MAALSNFLELKFAEDPLAIRFLKAIARSKALCRPKFPACDLGTVLRSFQQEPFEPLDECSMRFITIKSALLVALVSACKDKIIFALDAAFLPKVTSDFHISKKNNIPSICEKLATTGKQIIIRFM